MNIIGIDGGGTKTKAVLFQQGSGINWTSTGAGSNPHSTTFQHSVRTIIQLIESAIIDNELKEDAEILVSLGIAGLGRETEQEKWLNLFQKYSRHLPSFREVIIENDGKIALYSATLGADGIVSICGTGALTFGLYQGKSARVGGWGHLVGGDPGSGYYIGARALEMMFEAEDGLRGDTLITKAVLQGEGVDTVQELIPIIYGDNREKHHIAAFARYVFAAAEEGDEAARTLMKESAQRIAHHGLHLYDKLFPTSTSKSVPFVLAGGIFQNQLIVEYVKAIITETPALVVTVDSLDPVIGSVVVALKKAGYSEMEIVLHLSDKKKKEV